VTSGHGGASSAGRACSGGTGAPAALAIEDVAVSFGGVAALAGVTLSVPGGEVRAVIGPNGAGKTTLFNVITGAVRPDRGRVRLGAVDITGRPPHRIARLGLARTFQITNIYGELTVGENVWLAVNARAGRPWSPWPRPDGAARARVRAVLERLGLGDRVDEPAANLSHADQRVVEIAIALGLEPAVLLLDEPTQGVSTADAGRLVALVAGLAPATTVLLIEHDVEVVRRLAATITVLDRGRVIAEGAPADVMADRRVREVYLGTARV
jgi:branched-chain amino acid transport system ATP-binding protein